MELIVVRHALPVRREVTDGAADPGLGEEGRAQAEHMADYLAHERIDAVFTSPLRRARETAAPLAARLGLDVHIVDDVAEFDRDASEYVPVEELRDAGDPRFEELLRGDGSARSEVAEFSDRVVAAFERIIADHPGATVAVVCHGGVINAYTAHVLGFPFELPGKMYPNYTSLHRFAASRSGVRSVLALNETAHLRGTGLPVGLFASR